MGFIIIIPFAAVALWSIFAIHRWLRQGGYGREWWKAFTLLACAGAVLGIWFAFFLHYNVATKHIEGFPIPVQISGHEKPADPWVKAPMPLPILIGGIVTNWLCGVALCLAPIAAAAFLKENRTRPDAQGNPHPTRPS